MLIGHVPAGFVWTRAITRRIPALSETDSSRLLALGLIASILPDADMLYFHLIDGRRHLHHGYWTHIPLFWTMLFALPLMILWLPSPRLWLMSAVIYTNVMLHLALDTIVGKIRWLYPFSRQDFYLFEVTARYKWAYWNFILHWTFLLEIGVILWALTLIYQDRWKKRI